VKETKRWKRKEHGEAEVQSDTNTIPVPLEHHGDKVKVQASRTRPREDAEEDNRERGGKKGHFEVPPLELCLGKEGLRKLKEAELSRHTKEDTEKGNMAEEGGKKKEGGQKEKAAAGPGATGKLSGAKVCARQEP
jgi:hypothetical protein